MAIELKKLIDPKSIGFPWLILAIACISLIYINNMTMGYNTNPLLTPYVFVYFAVAIVLAAKEISFISGSMVAVISGIAAFATLGSLDVRIADVLVIVCFGLILANEFKIIKYEPIKANTVKYLAFIPFCVWIALAIWYFQSSSLRLDGALVYGGLALLSIISFLTFTGAVKEKKKQKQMPTMDKLKWIGLATYILGMILHTAWVNWGLQLLT